MGSVPFYMARIEQPSTVAMDCNLDGNSTVCFHELTLTTSFQALARGVSAALVLVCDVCQARVFRNEVKFTHPRVGVGVFVVFQVYYKRVNGPRPIPPSLSPFLVQRRTPSVLYPVLFDFLSTVLPERLSMKAGPRFKSKLLIFIAWIEWKTRLHTC